MTEVKEDAKYTKADFVNYLKTFTNHAPLSWIINNLEYGDNLERWMSIKNAHETLNRKEIDG